VTPFAIPAALADVRTLARSWWKAGLGAVIGAALALPVGQCQGEREERTRQAARAAEARELAVTLNAARVQKQAVERETASAAILSSQQEINRADDAVPDSRPSDKRRAALCGRVRDLERRGAAIPADLRSQCRAGADAAR
jgi:hypothetical protein